MSAAPSLHDATIQDIQLELIRRNRRGERVYDRLLHHRPLWTAVLLDRLGTPFHPKLGLLPADGLIKLRDLPQNRWNADMLFVLTSTPAQALALARVAEDEAWGDEVLVYEDRDEVVATLGTDEVEYGLLSVWWDRAEEDL